MGFGDSLLAQARQEAMAAGNAPTSEPTTWTGSLGANAYSNPGNGIGGAFGFTGTPGSSYFGGNPAAAAAATNYYTQQASAAMGQAAPTISDPTQATDQADTYAGLGMQKNAYDLASQTAQGGGPAQAAAATQLQQGTDASIASNLALANSARGPAALASASKNALTQNTQATQTNAQNTAALRAQMAATAQGQLGAIGQGYSASALGNENANYQAAQSAAELQEEQNKTNAATAQGYQQLGFNAQQSALGASEFNQGTAAGINENNANAGANLTGSAIGAGALALAAFADVKMKEPGGSSGWTLREEPDFLLARNDRTGELRKVATEPLTHEEHRQAMAPHGAGPIGHGLGRTVGDLDVGDMGEGAPEVIDSAPGLDQGKLDEALNARYAQQAPFAPTSGSLGTGAQPGMLDAAANNTAGSQLLGAGTDPGATPIGQVDPTAGATLGTPQANKQFAAAGQPAGAGPSKLSQFFKGVGTQMMNRPRIQTPTIGGPQMAQQVAAFGR